MHSSSYKFMQQFVLKYLNPNERLLIADIGSYGRRNYRPIFERPKLIKWKYVGIDLLSGPNVDIVVKPFDYSNIAYGTYDVVISGQTLEHVKYPFLWMRELNRILKLDGLICIICPWLCKQHEGPTRKSSSSYKDYWRVMESGMRLLLEDSNFKVLDVFQDRKKIGSGGIGDTIGIGQKLGDV